MEPVWIHSATDKQLPRGAVRVADSINSVTSYIGRTVFEGELLPTTIVPRKRSAYVAWRGKEHEVQHYEVLVGKGYKWQTNNNDSIPANAIPAGTTICGEQLYFGRGRYMDTMCLGRIQPSEECIYFSYNGDEIRMLCYEFLVSDKPDNWVSTSFEYTPEDAVVAGRDTDGSVIYVGRILVSDFWNPAKIIPSKTCAYVCIDGLEIFSPDYEILCGDEKYSWLKVEDHNIPPNAVETDCTTCGEPLYVGRGEYKGSLTPGLISLTTNCLLLPYGGKAINVYDYEVLVKQ